MRGIDFEQFEHDPATDLCAFPLAGRRVVVRLVDLHRLAALGPGTRWTTASTRIMGRGVGVPGIEHPEFGLALAARLIVGASPTERIGYRNGDPFDLRPENIALSTDPSGRAVRRKVALPILPSVEAVMASWRAQSAGTA